MSQALSSLCVLTHLILPTALSWMPLLLQFTDEEAKAQKDEVTSPEILVCWASLKLPPGSMIC